MAPLHLPALRAAPRAPAGASWGQAAKRRRSESLGEQFPLVDGSEIGRALELTAGSDLVPSDYDVIEFFTAIEIDSALAHELLK